MPGSCCFYLHSLKFTGEESNSARCRQRIYRQDSKEVQGLLKYTRYPQAPGSNSIVWLNSYGNPENRLVNMPRKPG
jgi:hypothetical protein